MARRIFTLTVDLEAMNLPAPEQELSDILKRLAAKVGPDGALWAKERAGQVYTLHGDRCGAWGITPEFHWISVNDVIAGKLPDKATGVLWTDTKWRECVEHLALPSWAHTVTPSDERNGIVLYHDDVECHACEEGE